MTPLTYHTSFSRAAGRAIRSRDWWSGCAPPDTWTMPRSRRSTSASCARSKPASPKPKRAHIRKAPRASEASMRTDVSSAALPSAPATTTLTYLEAIREAMREEMRRDPEVILMGEDIGIYGGAFKLTKGLIEEFGPERVID